MLHNCLIFKDLLTKFYEPRKFIQALLGPRQVGKTHSGIPNHQTTCLPTRYTRVKTYHMKVYYWRDRGFEVDFILQRDDEFVALEVKSSITRHVTLYQSVSTQTYLSNWWTRFAFR